MWKIGNAIKASQVIRVYTRLVWHTDRRTDTAMSNTAVALQTMRTRCENSYLFIAGDLIAPAANVTERWALARWQPRILFMSSTSAIDSCIKMRQAAEPSDAFSQ